MRIQHQTYAAIFNTVYAGLMSNMLLIVGCAPLVLLLFTTDPARSWPLFALVMPLCAPALVGVFAVMSTLRDSRDGRVSGRARPTPGGGVLTTFGRTWLASWWRAVALSAMAVGALVVLGVDITWAFGQRIGAVMIPVLVMLMVLVVITALHVLVMLAERPTVRLRSAMRACLYLALRRWYLTGLSLVVLWLLVQIIAARPAIGLGLAAAPLLYLVWANCRFALRPVLDDSDPEAVPPVADRRATADGPVPRRAAAARA